ncbi:MAG TPA: HAMP domain-containing sensor histidine kinase [Candidatus Omnitrophota bacterium]|nr:HAMP domain-containing sensor histidine kinase [Candidatus Omnitrophota bacterium]
MTQAPRPVASLTIRLVAAALVWLAVLLALGGVVLAQAFRQSVEQEFGHRLDALLRAVVAATEIAPDGSVTMTRPLGDPRFDQIFSGWYWQVSPSHGRPARSRSLWDATLPAHQGPHLAGPADEPLMVAERDVEFPGAGKVHVLVAGDLREVLAETRKFDTLLMAAMGLLGLGMALAVVIQVRFGLRPLRRMEQDLEAVRRGEQARLAGSYPQEVAPLAEAMNGVLDHDQVLIERARTHVGNLAHSLKTPLSVLQAEMHAGPDPTVVRDQVQSMTRLVEYHLGRAAAVAGAGRALGTQVPVAAVAADLARVLGRIHPDKAIRLDVAEDTVFRGQREDLEEILGNLADNAAKWARSTIRIAGRDSVLTVEDDGPGLSPEQAEAAAGRGARLDERVPGWGLGLAIVTDLVAINGGTAEFGRSDLGGLKVVVTFPAPNPAPRR